jgi:hypothetical protein
MRKIIIVNGLISGVIVSAMFFISYPLMRKGILNMNSGMIIGYASMVIALSMIFFGIKTYRDQYSNGSITFGRGVKIGLLIALIASCMYAASWEVFSAFFAPDFAEYYEQGYIDNLKAKGADLAALNAAKEQMAQWRELYKNPPIRFAMVMAEILPVGIIITLICAAILRKRQILPA